MKIIIIFLFFTTLPFFSAGQEDSLGNQYFNRSACIQDIQQLKKVLINYHPSLYTYITKANLSKKIKDYIYKLPDSLNSYRFHSELTLLINQIRDGHLYLSTNQTINNFELYQGHVLPFSFRIFDYKLFVKTNYSNSSIKQWDAIKEINGVPSTELIYELLPLLPTDGYCSSRKLKLLEENFALLYSRKFGFSTSYNLKTISKNTLSKPLSYSIKGIKTKLLIQKLSVTKHTLFFEIDKERNLAYVKIPTFNSTQLNQSGIKWHKYLKSLFKQIEKDSIHSLILDLRGNEGGSVHEMSALMEYLMFTDFQLYQSITLNSQLLKNSSSVFNDKQLKKIKKATFQKPDSLLWNIKFTEHYYFPKKNSFQGNLYVLMDGGTYSSASHAVQLLQHRPKTKFFGDETGGNGVSSNAGKTITIPLNNSKFNIHLPLMKGTYKTKKIFSTTSGILPEKYCGNELLMELKYPDICLLNVLEDIIRVK